MTLFPPSVDTERLRLERLTDDRLFELYEHANEDAPRIEAVTEYLHWDPHRSPGETREFVDGCETAWEAGERATWVIVPREDEPLAGELAGLTGLGVDWDRRVATLGCWLRPSVWGQGYSGERAHALMAVAFDRLDLDVVAVTHVPENEQSGRAIEKYIDTAGGRREGYVRNGIAFADGCVHDVIRHSVTAAEWHDSGVGQSS